MIMEELLATLLESEILTEDTKTQLEEAVNTKLEEAIEEAKTEAETKIRAELTEQFIADKEALVEALDTKAEEFLKKEVSELHEDIERFRDLEAEYSERLVEAKAEMAEVVKSDLNEMVDAMDTFIEMRLKSELDELKESIEDVRKHNFGMKVFENFAGMYQQNFADEDNTSVKLEETASELEKLQAELKETKDSLDTVKRGQKMEQVLENLQGRPREVMEAILKSVPTDKLEEGYENFIPRVLHQSAEEIVETNATEKENEVLAESKTSTVEKVEESVKAGTIEVTGDSEIQKEEILKEDKEEKASVIVMSESNKEKLRAVAGIQ